jgi:secreted trypsin-like serine protease
MDFSGMVAVLHVLVRLRAPVAAMLGLLAASPAAAIVGGAENAGPLAAASLMVLSSNGGVCSAVVVAPDAVLTAAHCAAGAAEHRVHWRGDDAQPVLIAPAAKDIHPGYVANAIATRRRSIDLALLRLPKPLPARFSQAVLSGTPVGAGTALEVGGYGVLSEGDARTTGTFRTAPVTVVEPYGPSKILVWTRGRGGVGACSGDSGGPIAAGTSVVAIVAFAKGPKGRDCGDLTQGTLLSPQRAWIDATLRSWGRSARWE